MDTILVKDSAPRSSVVNKETFVPKAYPGRFLLYCGMDRTNIDKPDYSDRVVAELVRCHNSGARGVGELSDKGSGLTDTTLPRDKRLHADDPRLDAFWEKCAELKMPVNLHVADHPSCWTPLDVLSGAHT